MKRDDAIRLAFSEARSLFRDRAKLDSFRLDEYVLTNDAQSAEDDAWSITISFIPREEPSLSLPSETNRQVIVLGIDDGREYKEIRISAAGKVESVKTRLFAVSA
jgi:hypothetical protein